MKGFLSGLAFAFVLVIVLGLLAIESGKFPLDPESPDPVQRWVANAVSARSREAAQRLRNPLPVDAANEIAGMRLYVKNCAVCHGTSDGRPSATAEGLYHRPPQFATEGMEDGSLGITYMKIRQGVPFTGMPAFGKVLSETQTWQIALFLHHIEKLAPPAAVLWRTIPTSEDLIAGNWRLPRNWRALVRQSDRGPNGGDAAPFATGSPHPLPSRAPAAHPAAAAH